MKQKLLTMSIVSLLGFIAAACSVQFTTEISKDGSGEFVIRFAISEEDIADIEDELDEDFEDVLDQEMGESDLEDACKEIEKEIDLGRRADTEYSEKRGEFSCEIIIEFDDIDELIEIYTEMDIGEIIDIDLDRDGDLTYELDVDLTFAEDVDEFGVNKVEYLWVVTVPGSVEDSNADERRGRTLTWELDAGDIEEIELSGGPGGLLSGLLDGAAIWWILGFGLLCLFGLLLAAGGAGLYFYTKKKKEE